MKQGFSRFVIHRIKSRTYSQDELDNMLVLWSREPCTLGRLHLLATLLERGANPNTKPLTRSATIFNPFPSHFTTCVFRLADSLINSWTEGKVDIDTRLYRPITLLRQHHTKEPHCRFLSPYFFSHYYRTRQMYVRRYDSEVVIDWSLSQMAKLKIAYNESFLTTEWPRRVAVATDWLSNCDDGRPTRVYFLRRGKRFWPVDEQESQVLVESLQHNPGELIRFWSVFSPGILILVDQLPHGLERIFERKKPFASHYDVYKHMGWTEEQLETWKDVWQYHDKQSSIMADDDDEESDTPNVSTNDPGPSTTQAKAGNNTATQDQGDDESRPAELSQRQLSKA